LVTGTWEIFANNQQLSGFFFLFIMYSYNVYIWYLQYFYTPCSKGFSQDLELVRYDNAIGGDEIVLGGFEELKPSFGSDEDELDDGQDEQYGSGDDEEGSDEEKKEDYQV
jgi:hypothetical protein